MSATNRAKRKQAKRKARERRGRAKVNQKPKGAELLEGARHLPDQERLEAMTDMVKSGKVGGRALRKAFEKEAAPALAAERSPFYPDLAERLAADGWADTKEPVYLRFEELPEGGRSTTELEGVWEKGVSVFAGRMTKGGHYVLTAKSWAQPLEFMRLCSEQDRDAYFVRGKRAGKGGAGEPLLESVSDFDPVPDGCVIALPGGSRALDLWNERRLGAWPEDVPELSRYFEED